MSANTSLYAVIMAGGVGSRFWPMSRKRHPKQFIDVLGTGETLIQSTYRRLLRLCPPENILVVTNKDYVSIVREQLPNISEQNILAEPARKNTAPCITYAAWKIFKRNNKARMIVAPSDHIITREDDFVRICEQAFQYVLSSPQLLTIGIKPSRPDTGYGYIQFDPKSADKNGIMEVKTFTEKPTVELAEQFIESGEFVWNSGMFVWSADTILEELKTHLPDEYALFAEHEKAYDTNHEESAMAKAYAVVRNISVDYGLMEKTNHAKVIPADIGWSDLGTWGALYDELKKNKGTNSVIGNQVMMYDSSHCIVHVPKNKLTVIQGLEGFIVAEKDNMLLICKMSDEQKIKNLVNEIKIEKGDEFL
ncbi:MAG: mannose-1-phosphate guanylyltransferase [Candidatus Competibacteraceae bacterium]|nr:mannose-1-phosphate guanylyltransferase [Candidatus Competibacteraceae bacterium]